MHRKGRVERGLLFGVLCGAAAGAIIGLATYQECGPDDGYGCLKFGPGFSALIGAALGINIGSITGMLVGITSKKEFRIYGRKEKFEEMKAAMMKKRKLKSPNPSAS